MEIRETHVFTRQILESGQEKEAYRLLQLDLVENPELGVVGGAAFSTSEKD